MDTNALLALLRRLSPTKESASSIASLIGRIGLRGVVLLARGYLGPLADRASTPGPASKQPELIITPSGRAAPDVITRSATTVPSADTAVLGLALMKLVYEVGEIALHNPTLDPAGKLPVFELDDQGRSPAMSLAHVVAATRLWQSYTARREQAKQAAQVQLAAAAPAETPRTRRYAARSEYYATAPRYSYATMQPMATYHAPARTIRAVAAPQRIAQGSRGTTMATTTSASRGCRTCGGSAHPAPQSTPSFDPCAGGLPAAQRPAEGCACGGSCGCATRTAPTKTYDSSQCPTFAISCETKTALRDCVKTALCDFLRCVTDTLCPDGKFQMSRFDAHQDPEAARQLQADLIDCVGQLACSFMHCVPDALCPPPCESPSTPTDCLPCDYAVEVVR